MTKDEVLAKVRKLLNMTTENGCTEAEAAIAAGQAQKLLLKYDLAAVDLDTHVEEDEETIEAWEDPLDTMPSAQKQTWRGQLAMTLCAHNGCSTYWWNGFEKPMLRIVGRASDATATRYLYDFCLREIERLAREYKGNGRTWLNNWRLGVIEGIQESLREARKAACGEYAQETGTALVVVEQSLAVIDKRAADADKWAHAKFKLKKGRASYRGDHRARMRGREDGRNIDVNGSDNKRVGPGNKQIGE